MRITFLLGHVSLAGGVRVVARHARGLTDRGHRVVVVSVPRRRPPLRRRVRSVLSGRGWPRHERVEASHLDDLGVEHRVLPETRAIRDGDVPDADVVIATWWETAEWAAALHPGKGKRVLFVQGYEVYAPQPAERVRATWRLPFHKIAVSRWLADLARQEFGDEDVSLVPNAVDHDLFRAGPRGRQAVPTVGTIYSEHGVKGCDIVLEAIARAREQVADLRLVCFGTQPPSPGLPLPHHSGFVLRPSQQEVPTLYARCDAWLIGSRSEGFGLPILEAMACHTPVISTPTGAAPELVSRDRGWLVRPEDAADMARAIVEACRLEDAEWRRRSQAAYEATLGYTWKDATRLFEAALVHVCSRREVGATAG